MLMKWLMISLLSAIGLQLCLAEQEESGDHALFSSDVNHDVETMYDFLATRGRRANDHFWANRGKRSSPGHLKPNGFLFVMGKKSEGPGMKKNALKPNGFNFLLAGKRSMPRPNSFLFPVKKDSQAFRSLRPNGFNFPQLVGKRAKSGPNQDEHPYFNVPKPTSFFWPSAGKRDDANKAAWKNMIRPTGFLFSMSSKGKRPDSDISEETAEGLIPEDIESNFAEEAAAAAALEEMYEEEEKREDMDSSFFAGRGKRPFSDMTQEEINTFFAGRGKKEDAFFAGRGKKYNNNDPDIFVAGRG